MPPHFSFVSDFFAVVVVAVVVVEMAASSFIHTLSKSIEFITRLVNSIS